MILQLGDDGVVSKVNEDDLIYVDKNELDELIDRYNHLKEENEQLNQFKKQVFQIIDDSIKIYEDTTTNDEFLQIQLDTKLQTLYNLRKELLK